MKTQDPAIGLLRSQFAGAWQMMDAVMADVDNEAAHWAPPGTAHPIGALYAHVVFSADALVNGMLLGGTPLFALSWAGRTGSSEPPPGPDPGGKGFPDWTPWARRVRIDLPAMRRYAGEVRISVDAYLSGLADADLGKPVDLSWVGLGMQTVGYLLTNAVVGHAFAHLGEIACLKGIRGGKGFPF